MIMYLLPLSEEQIAISNSKQGRVRGCLLGKSKGLFGQVGMKMIRQCGPISSDEDAMQYRK